MVLEGAETVSSNPKPIMMRYSSPDPTVTAEKDYIAGRVTPFGWIKAHLLLLGSNSKI
jgi:hypothetical protein